MHVLAHTALLGWLAAAAACRIALIEPVPLRGPSPASIAVYPLALGDGAPADPLLLTGLDLATRGRGYRVPSLALTAQLLGDAAAPLDDLAAVGRALDADAVLVFDVLRFDVQGDPLRRCGWDLRWRLLSTRGHGELWRHEHTGSWAQRDTDVDDPLRRLDEEPAYVPFGGNRARSFRSLDELCAELHRGALEHLPRWMP